MKSIQPLVILKKHNSELYDIITSEITATTKDARISQIYWNYCFRLMYDHDDYSLTNLDWFYFKSLSNKNNTILISELGKLLLTGWCYGADTWSWTKEIYHIIYNSFWKETDLDNGKFGKGLEYRDAVNHIRLNIKYYYSSQDECRLYLLEQLFPKELSEILPPKPLELAQLEEVEQYHERYNSLPKKQLQAVTELNAEYVEYLLSEINDYEIEVLDIENFKRQYVHQKIELKQKIMFLKNKYNSNVLAEGINYNLISN